MAATVFPPATDNEPALPDDNNNGGSTPGGPNEPDHRIVQLEPQRPATPSNAYRIVAVVAIIWITALFGTLAIVLESRWAHSPNWVSIGLPQIFYLNTAILLLSSLSVEWARRSLRAGRTVRCIRGIVVSLWLGFLFLAGQAFAWQEISLRGLHFDTNLGSFFLYLITGAHALPLLGGMALLGYLGFLIARSGRAVNRQAALGSLALFWHFTAALWLCLLALLFVTIQR